MLSYLEVAASLQGPRQEMADAFSIYMYELYMAVSCVRLKVAILSVMSRLTIAQTLMSSSA